MESATRVYRNILFGSGGLSGQGTFEKAMLDASADCIKIISPEGKLLNMNRAGCIALGVPLDSSFGMAWLPLLPPEIQELGQVALGEAALGQSARFAGRSEMAGDVRYWDNLLTPIANESGEVKTILCVSRDITAQTVLERRLEDAIERETLMAQEMRHRVKNIYSIVSGLIMMAEREANHSSEDADPLAILRAKLGALARASDAVFADPVAGNAEAGRSNLSDLIRHVMKPYEGRFDLDGYGLLACAKNVTTIALFLHEMATNSVKYGAFSQAKGRVSISWTLVEEGLRIAWTEYGGPQLEHEPPHQGFGSDMIGRMARAAGGRFDREWRKEGLRAVIVLGG
ncbi:MAG: PAS domain-containing protein [Rhizobiaceae bacterium]|nr:PAS domain-containing protein [Rhizobiaceae bacterium]